MQPVLWTICIRYLFIGGSTNFDSTNNLECHVKQLMDKYILRHVLLRNIYSSADVYNKETYSIKKTTVSNNKN